MFFGMCYFLEARLDWVQSKSRNWHPEVQNPIHIAQMWLGYDRRVSCQIKSFHRCCCCLFVLSNICALYSDEYGSATKIFYWDISHLARVHYFFKISRYPVWATNKMAPGMTIKNEIVAAIYNITLVWITKNVQWAWFWWTVNLRLVCSY